MSSSISNFKPFGVAFAAGLLVPLALFVVGSEWLVRHFVLPHDNFHALTRLIDEARHDAVALGDSRTCTGFVASEAMGNLAFPGMTIQDIAEAYRAYAATRVPRLVLLQANPYLLRFTPAQQAEEGGKPFASLYSRDRKIQMLSPAYRPRLIDYWKRLALRKSFAKPRPMQPHGGQLWERELEPGAEDFPDYLGATLGTALPPPGCADREEAEKFIALARALKESGATVILVSPPVSPYFLEKAGEESGFREALVFFRKSAEDLGLPFIDLSASIKDPALFNDNVHLNEKGARIYTAELLERVRAIAPENL